MHVVIIGQGIAGTTLAHTLDMAGCRLTLIDHKQDHHSSLAAAGVANPITGRRHVKTWQQETLFDAARSFYSRLPPGMAPLEDVRFAWLLDTVAQENDWMARRALPAYAALMQPVSDIQGLAVSRAGFVTGGFRLDTATYLDASGRYLAARHTYIQKRLELRTVAEADRVRLLYRADHVVLTEGAATTLDVLRPLLRPNLGIAVMCRLPQWPLPDVIVKHGVTVVPMAGSGYWVGTTYYPLNEPDSAHISRGVESLRSKLRHIYDGHIGCTHTRVGIRPSAPDRRPLVGALHDARTVWVLNGLGTKGVTLAPFAAAQLCSAMLRAGALMPELDIARFF